MKTGLRVAVLLAALSVAGCDRVTDLIQKALDVGQDVSSANFDAKLTRVHAEKCDTFCQLVTLKIEVHNTSSELLCIPSVYEDSSAEGALVFTDSATKAFVTTSVPYDPDIFHSVRYVEDMKSLTKLPQFLVQPDETRVFEIHLFQKFDLEKKPAEASLRFMGFPCRNASLSKPNHKIVDLTQAVTFE